jgi:hypothetical protein
MAYEVVNTSVPVGLLPGQAGFCDVMRTAGVPEGVCSMLGPFSRYRPDLAGVDSMYAIRCVRYGGSTWGVVSCVSPCGLDYTGRANRIAHHLVVPPSEIASVSPASLVGGYPFRRALDGPPRVLMDPPDIQPNRQPADSWARAGLAGWDNEVRSRVRSPQARVLLLLPHAVGQPGLLADLLVSLPVVEQWRLGVATACEAEAAWHEGIRLRVMNGDRSAAGGAWQAWPGEQVLDLRERPAVPEPGQGYGLSGFGGVPPTNAAGPADNQDRWIKVDPPPLPTASPASEPDRLGDLVIEIETPTGEQGLSSNTTPSDTRSGWPAWIWLSGCAVAGAACGAIVAFLLWKFAR